MTPHEMVEVAVKHLGPYPAMLDGDKMQYRKENPNSTVLYNGNVVTRTAKVWYGDIDVTKNIENLTALARELGESVYVLREMDARFDTHDNPNFENAVFEVVIIPAKE